MIIPTAPANTTLLITNIDRKEVFAGKLGKRVSQTLTVTADGKTYEIIVAPRHTFIRDVQSFNVGEKVRVNGRDVVKA